MRPLIFLAFGLVACNVEPPTEPTPDEMPDSLVAPPIDLVGEWTVVEVDGVVPDPPITVVGAGGTLIWRPACAGQGLSYKPGPRPDRVLFFDSYPADRPVCEIHYPASLRLLWPALEGQRTVEQRSDGSVAITGQGHRVVLQPLSIAPIGTPTD